MIANAFELALTCSDIVIWKEPGRRRLREDYEITPKRVNELCHAYLTRPANLVRCRPSCAGYENDGLFDLVTPSEVGDIWVEFVIVRDDPSDPGIEVVSSHKPDFPWPGRQWRDAK